MNTNIKTRSQVKDSSRDAIDSLSRTSIVAMGGISALVGLWAVACFASALLQTGPAEMARGLVTALTGV